MTLLQIRHRSYGIRGRLRILGPCVLCLTLAACGTAQDGGTDQIPAADTTVDTAAADPAAPDNTSASAPDTAESGENRPGVALHTIVEQSSSRDPQTQQLTLLDEFKAPREVEVESVENRHIPGQIDTVRTLLYDGISLRVYEVAGGKEILERMTVTSDAYATEGGLTVGISTDELEAIMGAPSRRRNSTYVYEFGGGLPTVLYADVDGNEVTQLEWRFPID